MAERIFHGSDKLIRHANPIRKRTNHRTRLAQRRDRTRVKSFVRTFELFQHREARTFVGLLVQEFVLLRRGRLQFSLQLAQPVLTLFDRTARGGDAEFFQLDASREFLQARIQSGALGF